MHRLHNDVPILWVKLIVTHESSSIRLPVRRISRHQVVVEERIEILEGWPIIGPAVPALLHCLIDGLWTIDALADRPWHAVTLVDTVEYFLSGHAWPDTETQKIGRGKRCDYRIRHNWGIRAGKVHAWEIMSKNIEPRDHEGFFSWGYCADG